MAVKTLHAVEDLLSVPPCLVTELRPPGSGRVMGSRGDHHKKDLSCIISDCGCAHVVDDKKAGSVTIEV